MVTAAPYAWMAKRRERYGDVFSSHFPFFGRMVYVADPALVKQVFTGDPASSTPARRTRRSLERALGDELAADARRGPAHAPAQAAAAALPRRGGAPLRRADAEATAREVERWPVGEPFALRPHMQAITLEVILRAVFGVRDGERMDLLPRAHPAARRTCRACSTGCRSCAATSGRFTPAARFRKALARGRRADLRGDRRAPRERDERRARRRAVAAARRPPRGRQRR